MSEYSDFFSMVVPRKSAYPLDIGDRILTLGSCFAGHITTHLGDRGFGIVPNAMGPLYNPLSMAKSLSRILEGRAFEAKDLHKNGEQYVSFSHHGDFARATKEQALSCMNEALESCHRQIGQLDALVLTLGTAFAYEMEDYGVVANCHRFPRLMFQRRPVWVEEGAEALLEPLEALVAAVPHIKIIVTLSPVRHLRDNPTENSLSKAILRIIAYGLVASLPRASYFPSYEIVLDELRDYRFFGPDRAHLTEEAVAHVLGRFEDNYLTQRAQDLGHFLLPIIKGLEHRSRNPGSENHRRFLDGLEEKLNFIEGLHPRGDLTRIRERLVQKLAMAGSMRVS